MTNDSRQPTHHGYAVNVKDHGQFADYSPLSDDDARIIWEGCAEAFWADADTLATDHGFREVYGEGRMSGWCVPQPQPHPEFFDDELAEWLDRFRDFERDILDAMRFWQDQCAELTAAARDRAIAEPAERAHWEARDTITVD